MSGKLSHEDVQEILAILDGSSFDELHIEMDDLKISLRRSGAAAPESPFEKPFGSSSAGGAQAPVHAAADARQLPAAPHVNLAPSAHLVNGAEIAAPMLGVFFRAPRPGADPYIQIGSKITPDSIIGIIEVMKFMNPVPAGVAGEVVEILAPDGQLVEFGQALLRVRPDGP
ncbi:MAG: acetyl-CoA carboxylase biotin carboxyl carrier protein [Xanthobacteraceae bacterium]|jgi:acetyl-CoA carboxylase biotin carboxyl carrier protein